MLRLIPAFPPTIGAAIVIVQHLDPRHDSKLAEILGRRTTMPVVQATDGMHLRESMAVTAPPDHHCLVNQDGSVSLNRSELVHFLRPSADLLFESAAAAYGPDAIAVILSGTGKDGALGAAAVKQTGGTVIVSNEESSDFFGMPGSAIALGVVDDILPLAQIADHVTRLVRTDRGAA